MGHKVTVTIEPNGIAKAEIDGMCGEGCTDVLAALTKAMDASDSGVKKKDEFFLSEDATAQSTGF